MDVVTTYSAMMPFMIVRTTAAPTTAEGDKAFRFVDGTSFIWQGNGAEEDRHQNPTLLPPPLRRRLKVVRFTVTEFRRVQPGNKPRQLPIPSEAYTEHRQSRHVGRWGRFLAEIARRRARDSGDIVTVFTDS